MEADSHVWLTRILGWPARWLPSSTRQAIAGAIYPEGSAGVFDSLTGLYNQAEFNKARPDADKNPDETYVLVDIMGVGIVNACYGQDAGDALIITAATAVWEAAAEYGLSRVYRRGGDELGVITTPGTAPAIAVSARAHLASRLAGDIPLSDTVGGRHRTSTFRSRSLYIGIATTFAEADHQIRQAKAARRLFGATQEDLAGDARTCASPARSQTNCVHIWSDLHQKPLLTNIAQYPSMSLQLNSYRYRKSSAMGKP